MGELLKQIKADVILTALVCIAMGVVLLVWPAETLDIFCKILAVGLIFMGVVQMVSYFTNRSLHPGSRSAGIDRTSCGNLGLLSRRAS